MVRCAGFLAVSIIPVFGGSLVMSEASEVDSKATARRRSLVQTNIIARPDSDHIPVDEEILAPTCSPSPHLAPPSANHLVPEVKNPAEGDTSGGLRRNPQPKITKCRDNAASTVKTSKSQILASESLSVFYDDTEHGDAIDSNQGSTHGVTFEYEDNGSISGITGDIGAGESGGSVDKGGGNLTIRYDEQGNFYIEESLSAPIIHTSSATEEYIGGIPLGIEEEEGARVSEEKDEDDKGQKREDSSSSSSRASRDVAALPVIPIISLVTLLLYVSAATGMTL
jgi:hypothetical protein